MSKIQWIDNQGACDLALEKLQLSKVWALDTEADFDNHAYGKKLALIQILGDQEADTAYLFDPLSGINLRGIQAALQNPQIMKILYAGDTDNRLFFEIWGVDIVNIWDIYQAAQSLALPKFGLGALCEDFLGIQTTDQKDKFQRANWLLRPLKEDKKAYAAEDVFHLIPLYQKLMPLFDTPKKLQNLEIRNKKASRARFHTVPRPWEKLKDYFSLMEPYNIRAKVAYIARDFLAKRADKPAYKVLENSFLLQWAESEQEIGKLFPKADGIFLDFAQHLLESEIRQTMPDTRKKKRRRR